MICFTIFEEHVIDMDWLEEEMNRENRLEKEGEEERSKEEEKGREENDYGEKERRVQQRRQKR